jgi:hypothetical protein
MATFINEAEGLTKIEQLQEHDNQEIYQKSIKLLETYFDVDDEEDAMVAPEVAGNQFQFGQTGGQPGGAGGGFNYNFGGV